MISALQRFFNKHNKIFMPVLLVVLAFVFIFGFTNFNPRGVTAADREATEFYGFQLRDGRQMAQLQQWTEISRRLDGMNQPRSPQEIEQAMLGRAVALYLADVTQVPEPNQEALVNFIRERPVFADPQSGEFDPVRFERISQGIAAQTEGEQLLRRVLEQDWRIERVVQALSGPGYASEMLARIQAEQTKAEWTLVTATFSREDFQPEITLDEEALQTFYDQRQVRYQTPEQLEVGAIRFTALDFVDQVTETPEEPVLAAYFAENREQFVSDDAEQAGDETVENEEDEAAEGQDAEGADETVAFEDVRDEVLRAWRLERAERLALEAASNLSNELYNRYRAEGVTPSPDALAATLGELGYTVEPVEAFDPANPGAREGFPTEILSHAADLGTDRVYTDLIPTDNGTVIFVYRGTVEAVTPPLDDVREAVERDYRAQETRRQFVDYGQELSEELNAALEDGRSFTEAAEELGLEVTRIDPFSMANLRNFPEGLSFQDLQLLTELDEGEVSEPQIRGNEGKFIYLAEKEIPEIPEAELSSIRESIRQRQASFSAQSVLSDLVRMRLNQIQGGAETNEG